MSDIRKGMQTFLFLPMERALPETAGGFGIEMSIPINLKLCLIGLKTLK